MNNLRRLVASWRLLHEANVATPGGSWEIKEAIEAVEKAIIHASADMVDAIDKAIEEMNSRLEKGTEVEEIERNL